MKLKVLGIALMLGWTATVMAEESKPSPFKFEMHGFISASLYAQDAVLGPSEGQLSSYGPNPQTQAATGGAILKQPSKDKLILNGDVRQSRFNFSLAGPQVFTSFTPKAVLEFDFMGGYGSGANGDASLTPRLRYAFVEIDNGTGTRVAAGQQNDLIFAMAPASLAHIGQPYGYGAGNIGWRRPALFGFHNFGKTGEVKTELAWEVGRANWNDNGTIGAQGVTASTTNGASDAFGNNLGAASALPAVEARATVTLPAGVTAFATGHWMQIDRNGVNNTVLAAGKAAANLDVVAFNAGFRAVQGPFTLAATGFTGKNLAPIIGSFQQFQPITWTDVHEMGGWVQGGFNVTKEFSAWAFIGADQPNQTEATRANFTRLMNVTSAGMLQYRDGGYAVGMELIHFHTRTRSVTAGGATGTVRNATLDGSLDGNQVIASVNYFF